MLTRRFSRFTRSTTSETWLGKNPAVDIGFFPVLLLVTNKDDSKQANTPALASIMRSRHLQFLPVPWRTSMKFDLDAEAQSQGHHNYFTLSEVTPKGTIPSVVGSTQCTVTYLTRSLTQMGSRDDKQRPHGHSAVHVSS